MNDRATPTGAGGLRIRYKLLIAYSALFLTIAVTSNIIVYGLVQRTVRSNIESQLSSTNEMIATMVRISAQLSVRNRLRAIAEKNREITGHFHALVGRGEMSEAEAKARAQEVMLSQSIGSTGYPYILDEEGVIVTHPKEVLIGQNLSRFEFIQEQLRKRTGYLEYRWKNPDEVEERPKALYMEPFEPWGWIISASCYLDEFRQLVHVEDFRDRILSVRLGETGYSYVVDDQGNFIIHPVLKGNFLEAEDHEGNKFVREILARKDGSTVYSWKNPNEDRFRQKLAMFRYLPEYHWIVVSVSPHDEFFAPARWVRNIFIMSTIVALLLLVPLSILVGMSITRPIGQLMRQISQATEGNLSVRMAVHSQDEVGRLAGFFNGLMEQLERKEKERARMEAEKERYMERLRQSEKLEVVGQLAGGVAHDFNNMLAAIMGHAELLGFEPLSADQRSSVDQILLTTSRAASLTRSLLDFSRKSTTRLDEVDAHQLLRDVAKLVSHTMDKRIVVVPQLQAPVSRLRVDPARLQNAILNLLLNARDAMPNGGEIRITTDVCSGRELPNLAAADPEAPYLRISVIDQGEGMDAETQAHAFEPFFTTKEPGKGTGLGLASVYGCIKSHGGDIRLVSTPGKGTTVELYLAVLSEPTEKEPARSSDKKRSPGQGHILVVEDEQAVRRFAEEALRAMGYTTSCCADGEAAVVYFQEHHATLSMVLLDLVMPRMGGREVFAKLQQIDAHVPVLLCSGFTERGDMRGELPAEAAGFLQKPYRMAELANAIEQALRRNAASTPLREKTVAGADQAV